MHSRAIRTAPTTRTCWIASSVQRQLLTLARQWHPLEVGGVLAGYWNHGAAVITHAIGPGEDAKHHAFAFLPDHAFHEREIARLYRGTNGMTTYLGDWHTHPNGVSQLSGVDMRTLRAIGEATDARCPDPLMLVLAGADNAWSTQAFSLGPSRRFLPRKVVSVDLKLF